MADLLLELFSEEIPARMQRQAAEDLKRLVTGALVDRTYLRGRAGLRHAAPARAACGGPARRPADLREERKGPRVGAPEGAIQGFLKSAGLARIEDATIEKDPKKGAFYVAVIEKPAAARREIVPAGAFPAEAIIGATFPGRSAMRWGAAFGRAGRAALGAPAAGDPLHVRRPA